MVYKEIIWNIIITSCGTKIYLGSLGRLIESRNKRLMIATCCVIKSVIEMRCLMKSVPSPCLFCNIIKLESILGNTLKMISSGYFWSNNLVPLYYELLTRSDLPQGRVEQFKNINLLKLNLSLAGGQRELDYSQI